MRGGGDPMYLANPLDSHGFRSIEFIAMTKLAFCAMAPAEEDAPGTHTQRVASPGSHTRHEIDGDRNRGQRATVGGAPLAELVATFELSSARLARSNGGPFGVTVLGGGATGKYTVTLAASTRGATVSGQGIPRTPVLNGPLRVVGSTVRLHAIIDKGVIEVIFNNRTAFATNTKLESPNATEIALFGVGAGVKGTLETWALQEANNRKPQPQV